MRWFEPNLQRLLCEAGSNGLRIGVIVRNVCNMEPSLFGVQHPYEQAYGEIYRFLRTQCKKPDSIYSYGDRVNDKGEAKHGFFFIDKHKLDSELKTKPDFTINNN